MHDTLAEFTALRRQARWAGLLYLLVALIAPIGLVLVPDRLITPGDAARSFAALQAEPGWLRLGIASELAHQTVEVFLVLALYRLFAPVHEGLARLMAVLGLVPIPLAFANVLPELAALMLAEQPAWLAPLPLAQAQSLAYAALRLHGQGLALAGVFWGLWLLPLGRLCLRSGFVARPVGWLLWLAGAAYVLDTVTRLLLPAWRPALEPVLLPMMSAELAVVLWLVIVGARRR